MAVNTKNYIKKTFAAMLKEENLSHITVTSITKRCKISRNSFYYHYTDIPSLLDEVVEDAVNYLLSTIPSDASLEQKFEALFSYSLEHKSEILHIHFSNDKQISEIHLLRTCSYIVERHLESTDIKEKIGAEQFAVLSDFLSYELFGQSMDWLNNHMSSDMLKHFHAICQLLEERIAAVEAVDPNK